jgi:ATP-binding cassette subfamily B protein
VKDSSKFTLSFYWRHIKPHKKTFILSISCIPLAIVIINTALPYFFSQAIGQLTKDHIDTVYKTLTTAAGLGLLGAILNFIGFQSLVRLEANVAGAIRESTFKELLGKDQRFFVNQKIGALTGKYIDFFRSYIMLQDLLIIRTLGFVLSVVIGLAILASQSVLVAGILLALLVVLVIEVKWSMNIREPWREQRKKYRVELLGKVADSLSNSLTVKSFGRETTEIASMVETNNKFRRAYIKDLGFFVGEGSVRVLLLVVMQCVAIFTNAYLVHKGSVDIATAIFCITYLQLIGSQLFTIGELLNGYENALLDASPLSEMLAIKNKVTDPADAPELTNFQPAITLSNITYQYDDADIPVLQGISLTIPSGQKVGLVGHSGSGKSTLSQLLLRFSDVTKGSITIDGQDIRHITQQSLHRSIGYVPQEPALFHRSLRDNIAYGKPDATDKEIIAAAKKANAWEFIRQMPGGLDTTVGERGVKLSGGQRQRIAIARAILKDAPILLLDEATSALDSESERLIQDALEKLMKNRTSIVIAHRLSTIASLDRIIVLNNGQVVEDGSHQELLQNNGTYSSLWQHQSGGFIEE